MQGRHIRGYASNALTRAFESAAQIPFDDSSRIVLMSDCHRGDESWADDFSRNQHIYFAALTHYYDKNYTYIELGDGDELWKNKRFSDIASVHGDVFWLLSRYFNEGRFYSIFGNHDIVKDRRIVERRRYSYFDEFENREILLFDDITHHEGLVLRHTVTDGKIFLVHGHQADYVNYRMWRLSRFLVRYFWRPLELYGINDPTSASKNNEKKESVEKKLIKWVTENNQMLIAGHTHRPMFPEPGEPPYFNDGCCVHPRSITAIEIAEGRIVLVKWEVKTRKDGSLFVGREVLAGPRELKDYLQRS
jgi:predicted phosphodiesterase